MKIIEVCDINSEGHKVRLSDGSYDTIPHNTGSVSVGEEWPPVKLDIETGAVTVAPTLAELNSDAQIAANILSEKVKDALDAPASTLPAE